MQKILPTNNPFLYTMLDGEKHDLALWLTYHKRYWSLDELKCLDWWPKAKKIFLVGQESNISDWVDDDPRIYVWDSLYKTGESRFYSFFWWWWQTVEVEKYQMALQKLVDPLVHTPEYVFECVMNQNKPHRRKLIHSVRLSETLQKKCLIKDNHRYITGTDNELECRSDFNAAYYTRVPYGHGECSSNMGTFVPYKIYNRAWFSVIAETRTDRNFFTEKTAKVILAKRMFVALGAKHLLKDLQAMGYQTFGDILDESYDDIDDDQERWQAAISQIEYVCAQNPSRIHQAVSARLCHNQQLLLREDLWSKVHREMIDILRTK